MRSGPSKLDSLYAEQLQQIVKMVGKQKVLQFLETLR